ncbi:hypothetical protein Cgig2_015796 [Carnegiea gigantea]|uniref:Histidine-containing phosphotransfer protein n=1 Tax=Carnegiea gigantea TaxID=171969 RepID=A0A9Q1KGW7_9CARY|nr:hypothetical protein Cgig2_015796 [Carnegiea gigantea]
MLRMRWLTGSLFSPSILEVMEEKTLKQLRTLVPHARPVPNFANPFVPQKGFIALTASHCATSLYHSVPGFLDEQFVQLEELQDDTNPNFVEEVATLFYRDSARLLDNIEQAMQRSPLDFVRLDNYMQQFKGSCSRCMRTFQQLKREYTTLKGKLEAYFQVYLYAISTDFSFGQTSRTKEYGNSPILDDEELLEIRMPFSGRSDG